MILNFLIENDIVIGGGSRKEWPNQFQFMCANIAFAVGLGNIWRFPYVTGENGGAARGWRGPVKPNWVEMALLANGLLAVSSNLEIERTSNIGMAVHGRSYYLLFLCSSLFFGGVPRACSAGTVTEPRRWNFQRHAATLAR